MLGLTVSFERVTSGKLALLLVEAVKFETVLLLFDIFLPFLKFPK
jgi:hypothetical protein